MLRVNRFVAPLRVGSRFVASSVAPTDAKPSPDTEPVTPKKELIWALKKEKGQGLSTDGDTDADAGFEVHGTYCFASDQQYH